MSRRARAAGASAPAGNGILPLALDDVRFAARGRRLIDGMTLRFEAGPRSVILGPNGAGKSLLLRLCHGLLAPTGGTIRWARADAGRGPRGHAMVFQQPVLLRRSAAANVDYVLAGRGLGRRARRDRVAQALGHAGLAALGHYPARLLSGGERQRLALARAWALDPEVLFLDEPTSNLDPGATRVVEEMIEGIRAGGAKIVMTTHDLGQARRIADEILFLHRGRLLERTEVAAFFSGPRSEAAAAFLEGRLLW